MIVSGGDLAADATASAGDDHHLALELTRHRASRLRRADILQP